MTDLRHCPCGNPIPRHYPGGKPVSEAEYAKREYCCPGCRDKAQRVKNYGRFAVQQPDPSELEIEAACRRIRERVGLPVGEVDLS